jgi:hypothetical protein
MFYFPFFQPLRAIKDKRKKEIGKNREKEKKRRKREI